MKFFTKNIGIFFIILLSPLVTRGQSLPIAPQTSFASLSICDFILQHYHIQDQQQIELRRAQLLLADMSQSATLTPRAPAEKMMELQQVNNVTFHCKDRTTVNDFTAYISFNYVMNETPVDTGNIFVRAVPPDEPQPVPFPVHLSSTIKKPVAPTTATPSTFNTDLLK